MENSKKSCDTCKHDDCRKNPEWKKCSEDLEHWEKKKDCTINVIERDQFAGCQLQCIKGYDCVYYQ